MILTTLADGVVVLAPAKLNLFLEIKSRRADGFHEIETLMVAIGIFDSVNVQATPNGRIGVQCFSSHGQNARERAVEGTGSLMGEVPDDQRNLVVQSVQRLRRAAGVRQGARIRLLKRIPSAAGLGGASSDAAAALVAANRVWKLNWSLDELASLAAEIGSDVPFFLGAGAAVCRGRGEIIETVEMSCSIHVVVVRPPAGLSTAAVYERCRPPERPASVKPLLEALRCGNVESVAELMENRLEETAVDLTPWMARMRCAFRGLGCLGHQMSGSGTSYFGICRHKRHARRVAACLRGRGFGYVRVASTLAPFGRTQIALSQP